VAGAARGAWRAIVTDDARPDDRSDNELDGELAVRVDRWRWRRSRIALASSADADHYAVTVDC